MSGYFKVPREARAKCGLTDKLLAYCDLASRADFKTGEVSCSVRGLSAQFGWTEKKARCFLAWALPMIRTHAPAKIGAQQGHSKGTVGAHLPLGTSGSTDDRGTVGADEGRTRGTITKKKKNNTPPTPPRGFEEFWLAYPRKAAKAKALKAWAKLEADEALIERIMLALECQKDTEQWQKEGGKYIPLPASWINGERWEDEPDENSGPYVYGRASHVVL